MTACRAHFAVRQPAAGLARGPQYIKRMQMRVLHGFTLYELLITVVVVGVVLMLGVPNISDFARNSRITSAANDLHGAFQLARSEAVKAKSPVTICASDNSTTSDANCQGSWQDGFIVFTDLNGDLARSGSEERVLRAYPALASGVSFAVAEDAGYFSFAATGVGRGNVGGEPALSQLIVCDDRGPAETSRGFSAARLLVATPLGRAIVVRDYTMVNDAMYATDKACP